jgi:hypothetical protein
MTDFRAGMSSWSLERILFLKLNADLWDKSEIPEMLSMRSTNAEGPGWGPDNDDKDAANGDNERDDDGGDDDGGDDDGGDDDGGDDDDGGNNTDDADSESHRSNRIGGVRERMYNVNEIN